MDELFERYGFTVGKHLPKLHSTRFALRTNSIVSQSNNQGQRKRQLENTSESSNRPNISQPYKRQRLLGEYQQAPSQSPSCRDYDDALPSPEATASALDPGPFEPVLRAAPTMPFLPINPLGSSGFHGREKCVAFHTMGICMLGELCPYKHEEIPLSTLERSNQNVLRFYNLQSNTTRPLTGQGIQKQVKQAPVSWFADGRPQISNTCTAIVAEGLQNPFVSKGSLYDLFSRFGGVRDVAILSHMGTAIINFMDHAAAKRALESSVLPFEGVKLAIYWFRPDLNQAQALPEELFGSDIDFCTIKSTQNGVSQSSDTGVEDLYQLHAERLRIHEQRQKKLKELGAARAQVCQELNETEKRIELAKVSLHAKLSAKNRGCGDTPLKPTATNPDRSGKTQELRDKLAKLEAEAKSLGLDPDSLPEATTAAASLPTWLGPNRQIDYRCRNISIRAAEDFIFDVQKLGNIRRYLTDIIDYESAELVADDLREIIVHFSHRWKAERVTRGPRYIPGVGRVQMKWVPCNAPVKTTRAYSEPVEMDIEEEEDRELEQSQSENGQEWDGHDSAEFDLDVAAEEWECVA